VVSRLRHPHIAQLVDGGEGEQGELWYAMELVEGQDLISHCAQRKLDLRARVRLLLDLCDAVAYAHRNLILHRDIKPSNVLVDGEGRLKLIDFGIAKGLDEGNEGLTLDQAPMTPRYAAPEQLRGERPTTATDLWQVAALGFELLTGASARKDGQLRRAHQAAVKADADHATSCGLDPQRLQKALRGDLDAILAKALRDEPEQRYANVELLSTDLRAWLQGQPVAVRRHERWYAARRFVSVHRWAVGFAGLAVLSVMAGGATALMFGNAAQREAKTANRTADLLQEMLITGKDAPDVRSLTLTTYIDYQVGKVIDADELPAEMRIKLLSALSSRAVEVRALDSAERAARQMLALSRATLNPGDVQLALRLERLATVLISAHGSANYAEASTLLDESQRIHEANGWTRDIHRFSHAQARAYERQSAGDALGAAEAYLALGEILERDGELDAVDRASILMNVAGFFGRAGEFDRSAAAAARALEIALNNSDMSDAAESQRQYSRAVRCSSWASASPEEALPYCEQTVSFLATENLEQSSAGVLARIGLGRALAGVSRHHDAIFEFERAQTALLARSPDGSSQFFEFLRSSLGKSLCALNRHEEAIPHLSFALERIEAHQGRNGYSAISTRVTLAEALLSVGDIERSSALIDPELKPNFRNEDVLRRWEALLAEPGPAASDRGKASPGSLE
jgi:hypothetical protein